MLCWINNINKDDFNNYTTNFEYEYGIVKDSDIIRPDTTGYILTDFWE